VTPLPINEDLIRVGSMQRKWTQKSPSLRCLTRMQRYVVVVLLPCLLVAPLYSLHLFLSHHKESKETFHPRCRRYRCLDCPSSTPSG
jgi:hypothetical protein